MGTVRILGNVMSTYARKNEEREVEDSPKVRRLADMGVLEIVEDETAQDAVETDQLVDEGDVTSGEDSDRSHQHRPEQAEPVSA